MAGESRFVDSSYSDANPLVTIAAVESWLGALKQPVALTGGTGFVGSHLVDTLCAAGIRPRVLVRNSRAPRWIAQRNVCWVEGDLGQSKALEALVDGAATVVHLAGVLRGAGEKDFMRGNRDGTARMVAAFRKAAGPNARFVHVSSQAAIGPSPSPQGLGADAALRPISAYGRSKAAAEAEVTKLAPGSWSIVRPPAIYGPRDADVFEFFRLAARGILACPSGERWITLANVRDVVRAVFAVAAVGRRRAVYHVGDRKAMTMEDLLRGIADAGGVHARSVKIPAWVFRVAGNGASALRIAGLRRIPLSRDKVAEILARHWTLSTEDSIEELGLGVMAPLNEGAAEAWRWYREMGWIADRNPS